MRLLAQLVLTPPADVGLARLLPEVLLLITVLTLLMAPLVLGRAARPTLLIAFTGLSAALLAALFAADFTAAPVEVFAFSAGGHGMLAIDGLTHVARLVILSFAVATLGLWALLDAERETHAPEFATLLLSSALGMILMASSTNLIAAAISIELASLPSFVLTAFDRRRRQAAEAALKYAIFGLAMSAFLLFGASLLYLGFGTLHIGQLGQRIATAIETSSLAAPLVLVGLIGLLAGVGFKIAAVPMHFWCPDVFEGASLPVAAWLSVASKAAGLLLLARIGSALASSGDALVAPVVIGVVLLAVVTVTWANLAALVQSSARRLLAYSSIAHAGNMMAIAAIVVLPGQAGPAAGALSQYLAMYALMNFGAFAALGVVERESGRRTLDAFAGLGSRRPMLALSLAVCLFSLIGLPPLGGFLAKFWVILELASVSRVSPLHATALWILVLVLVVNTALSLYYYARILREMYLVDRPAAPAGRAVRGGALVSLSVSLCAAALLLAGTLGAAPLKRWGDRVLSAEGSTASTDGGSFRAAAILPNGSASIGEAHGR